MSGRFSCGVEAAIELISGKWKVLILYFLSFETLRYGELKRRVPGVSHKMLTAQLKEMHADGLVARFDHGEIPPRVDYSLTPFGRSLATSLAPLCAWGDKHSAKIGGIVDRRDAAE